MLRLKYATRAGLLVLIAACTSDAGAPLSPTGDPRSAISDAAHAGEVPGFYFLPPMVPQPVYSGTFDAGVSPRVEVCELAGAACATTIGQWTIASGVTVNPGAGQYQVNWHTDDHALDPAKHYRISVFVGSFRLGFADVDVVATGKELKIVDTGEFIPLLDGRTLPIKFRIETGIVAAVLVTPPAAEIAVGETQQFAATLLDLHGNPMSGPPISWSSLDEAVATVDAAGLATGLSEGTSTISATAQAATGTAVLTVINPNQPPVAAADTFDAIGNVTVPVSAPGVLANDTDPDGNALSAVAGSFPTAQGGTFTLQADGGFTYLSSPGFTGVDEVVYEISDGSATASSTVTFVVSTRVWYTASGAAAPGDGRDTSPFAALKDAEGASAAGEAIFVLYGDGSTSGHDEGIVLKGGQSLTGQGIPVAVTATLNGETVVLLAAGSAPAVTRADAGATIALAQGNTVQGLAVTSGAGAGILGSGFGTFTAGSLTVAAAGGPAVDLATGTVAAVFGSLSSAGSPGAGVRLSNVAGVMDAPSGSIVGAAGTGIEISGGNAAVSYGGEVASVGPRPVAVSGRTGGAVTLSGAIASTGAGILVQGNGGGTIAFTGPSKSLSTGTGHAVELAGNAGTAVQFAGGGLVVATTTGDGFRATGGGTVTVTGAGNVLNSAGGVSLRVENTTVGAAGLTFRTVNATGGPNGIVLVGTGPLNGVQVTGSGGACSRSAPSCSGGTLGGFAGADGAVAGSAVYLDGVRNVSLMRMRFTGADNFGVRGTSVSGFTADQVLMDGVFGTSTAHEEGAIAFDELSGSALLRDSYVAGGATDNLRVRNTAAATLDRFVLERDTIGLNAVATGRDGVAFSASAGTMRVTVENSRFLGARAGQFALRLTGSASGDLVFHGNSLSNSHPAALAGAAAVLVALGQGAGDQVSAAYDVSGNTVLGARGAAIAVTKSLGTATANGAITGNVVGDPAVANSGSVAGAGIFLNHATRGKHRVRVDDNSVHQYSGAAGIHVLAGGVPGSADPGVPHDGSLHATITRNRTSHPGTNNPGGIVDALLVDVGSSSGDQYTVCLNVGQGGANDLAAGGRAAEGGGPFSVLANAPGATPRLKLAGYPLSTDAGSAAEPKIETTIQAANTTGGNPGYVETPNATTTYAGNGAVGAACDLP